MKEAASKIDYLIRLLRRGRADKLCKAVARRVYSNSSSLGLRRDLAVPFDAPPARIPIEIRPLKSQDDLSFLDIDTPGLTSEGVLLRLGQLWMSKADLRTCYVGLAAGGKPCYLQWLLPFDENYKIQECFGDLFPSLRADEALLEGAFTLEAYRGQGIMSCAMAQIAERAKDIGARWVITFVREDNIASLKGCKKAGFYPYVRRRELMRGFLRRVSFAPLPEGTLYPFDLKKEKQRPAVEAGAA